MAGTTGAILMEFTAPGIKSLLLSTTHTHMGTLATLPWQPCLLNSLELTWAANVQPLWHLLGRNTSEVRVRRHSPHPRAQPVSASPLEREIAPTPQFLLDRRLGCHPGLDPIWA